MSTDPNTGPSEHLGELKAVHEPELVPTLGWFSATTIVAGSMVGSGIFIVSADIARTTGTGGLLIAVWVFAGILTLLGAASYAKLAAYMPKAGGQYVFLKESWGEIPAFLFGWALLTVIQTGFLAAVAVAFTKYLGVIFPAISSEPLSPFFPVAKQNVLAVGVLLLLTLYNCTGIKNGAILQNIFTSLKVLALLLLVAVGLGFGQHLWSGNVDWSLALPVEQAAKGDWLTLFAFASVGALFSADAWNYVTFIGGEVKEPRKNLPKALILGTSIVVLLYLVANFAYLNLLTLPEIQTAPEDRVATVAMNIAFPGAGVLLMAGIILISTFGCLNGLLLAGARVFYAMAKDGLLFRKFAEVHPKTHSPNFSMWAQFVWASLLALSGTYGKLLDYIVFTSLIFYIVTMLGLLRLAKRIPAEVNMTKKRDYAVPVLYLIGASFIAFYLLFGDFFIPGAAEKFAAWDSFKDSKFFTSIAGLGLTALGLPVYFGWKAGTKRRAEKKSTTQIMACHNCGAVAESSSQPRGSGRVELTLGFLFFLTWFFSSPDSKLAEVLLWSFFSLGLVYSIWRFTNKEYHCPACRSVYMIPVNTPRGRELQERQGLDVISAAPRPKVKIGNILRLILYVFAVSALISFTLSVYS